MIWLRITDGTEYINLIKPKNRSGFHLADWMPATATYKLGGIWRDSPFTDGRKLVDAQWQHPIENIVIHLRAESLDDNITRLQDLRRLLEKANNYWTTDWQNEPVWIEAQSGCETNRRYALIYHSRITGDNNPYGQPLVTKRSPVQRALTLLIERGHWMDYVPGESGCAQLSAQKDWHYDDIWESSSNQPVGIVNDVEAGGCGYLLAGDSGAIWRTADPTIANNWASTALTQANCLIYDILELSNGMFYAAGYDSGGGTGYSYTSINCGTAWPTYGGGTNRGSNSYHSLCQGEDGKVYLATGSTLGAPRPLLSTVPASGVWNTAVSNSTWSNVSTVAKISARMILGVQNSDSDGEIWYSDDYWTTSERGYVLSGMYPTVLFVTDNGVALAGTDTGEIWSSTDGITWEQRVSGLGGSVYGMASNGDTVYATADSLVWISADGGYTWNWSESVQGAAVYGLEYSSFGWIVGNSGDIYYKGYSITLGRSETCLDEAFISNKRGERNLTNVWEYDNGTTTYTDQFPAAAFPFNLLQAAAVADDAVYFGIDTSLQANGDPPIDNLVFDIGTPAYGITGSWQYYDGAWTDLTVHDGTDAGGGAFTRSGVSSVHWSIPDDWVAVAVNGVSALWVRYIVTAVGGTVVAPTQQNRDVYSCIQPVVDIDELQVPGTLPALAKHTLHMRSDEDGPSSDGPDLYANRVIVGLRSVTRGQDFTAYLNAADEQNPIGIDCSLGSSTSFVSWLDAAPGRAARYQPTGYDAMAMRVRFGLANTMAQQYNGSYRAFLRCTQRIGSSGDIRVRLYIGTPWGSDDYWSDIKSIPDTISYNKLIDFGEIELPLSQIVSDEPIATTRIEVHAECTYGGTSGAMATLGTWMGAGLLAPYDTAPQGGVNPTNMDSHLSKELWYDGTTLLVEFPSLYFLDLILIPSDEWIGDFVDEALSLSTALSVGRKFEIDSITYPKTEMRGLVRNIAANNINAIYVPLTPGPAILQPNADQRLWFLFDKSDSLYTPDWNSSPHIGLSVKSSRVSRYLGMRGNR